MSSTNQHSLAVEARRWVVRLDELSDPERAELDNWLEASELHRSAFEKARVRWQELECLAALPDDPAAYGEPQAAAAANEAYEKRPRWLAMSLALAATLAGIAIVLVMLALPQDYRADYVTAVGEQMNVDLPDGSVMLVNTGTRLSVHFTGDARRVTLERGEAHFDVAHEPARPFVVEAGTAVVRAIGTAFTVHVHEEELEVTVTDGEVEIAQRVELANASAPELVAEIKPLQRLAEAHTARVVHNDVEAVSLVDPETIERKLAWHHGMLEFVNAPLGEVIADAGRYTDKTLEIVDPELMDYPVTVIAKTGNIEGLLSNLDASTDVLVVTHLSERRIVISSSTPAPTR